MGYFANFTNKKLTLTKKPITINGIVYDPKINREDIKGFKWFSNKGKVYEFFNINNDQNNESELFIFILSNGNSVYCVGIDEDDCRDKVNDYLKERFFAGTPVNINSTEMLGETNTKGFVDKLIL